MPDVPFQMLTALGLGRDEWAAIARPASWQMLRMNLNTFARHGVFEVAGMAEIVARASCAIRRRSRKARVLPYQLLVAYAADGRRVPAVVREALQDAMEIAIGERAGRSRAGRSLPGRVGLDALAGDRCSPGRDQSRCAASTWRRWWRRPCCARTRTRW